MEWLGDLLGTGASVASGGLFGLLGSVVGVFAKTYQEKQRQEWETKQQAYELQLLDMQMKQRAQETEHELAIVAQEGSWQGMSSSQEMAMSGGETHMWVNDIKSLFRPALTLTLWIISLYLFTSLANDSKMLSQPEVDELMKYMVYSIFFSASTATVWWFGDRALAPPGLKNR
tara:strand:- start:5004 stop:5522 length:519 start_codon:yes stop_codon:yes gene_type:complete